MDKSDKSVKPDKSDSQKLELAENKGSSLCHREGRSHGKGVGKSDKPDKSDKRDAQRLEAGS